jgi:hypothetical protein
MLILDKVLAIKVDMTYSFLWDEEPTDEQMSGKQYHK